MNINRYIYQKCPSKPLFIVCMGGGDLEAGRAGYSGVVIGQKKGMWNMGGMSITKSAKRLFITEVCNSISLIIFEYFKIIKKYSNIFFLKNNKKTKNMRKRTISLIIIVALVVMTNVHVYAQNLGIGANVFTPDNSALVEMQGTKGLLIPRMTTTERDAITSPAQSLLIFNTTTKCFETNIDGQWQKIYCTCADLTVTASAIPSTINSGQSSTLTASGASTYSWSNGAGSGSSVTVSPTSTTTYTVTGTSSAGCTATASVTVNVSPSCGSQVWMPANINVGTRVNGTAEQNNNSQIEKYCYNDVESNCDIYGGLYQWAEAMQIDYTYYNTDYPTDYTCDPCGSSGRQGICPSGYHIPTDLEWSRYEYCVESSISPTGSTSLSTFQNNTGWRGSTDNAGPGAKMKVTSSNSPSWDGTNASGFAALPAGCRYADGSFGSLGSIASFWSASEYSSTNTNAWCRYLSSGDSQSSRNNNNKKYGLSVRCLKN